MGNKRAHTILTSTIAAVWLINGFFCKVLNLVPRHQQIVARIFGNENARLLNIAIGCAEVVMAIWIMSKTKTRFNAIAQIVIVITMNIIEFILAPDLLLWGKVNALFALLFSAIVYYNEFYTNKS